MKIQKLKAIGAALLAAVVGCEIMLPGASDSAAPAVMAPGKVGLAEDGSGPLRWLWETGEELAVLEGHTGSVLSVAWSPDGRLLVSGGGDNTVRMWNTETGEQLAVLKGHTYTVYSVAFSPDGNRLASEGKDGMVRLWGPP